MRVSHKNSCKSGRQCLSASGIPAAYTINVTCLAIGRYVLICDNGVGVKIISICDIAVMGEY